MQPTIRPYRPGDELGMAHTHSQSILVLCSRDYSPESIVIWAQKKPEAYLKAMESGETFFVIDDNGTIAGIGSWKGNEVAMCYMHPEHTGKGLARTLLQTVEADYRAKTGNTSIDVESTITAKPFYEKMGFKPLEKTAHVFRNGTTIIDAWKMRKDFTA